MTSGGGDEARPAGRWVAGRTVGASLLRAGRGRPAQPRGAGRGAARRCDYCFRKSLLRFPAGLGAPGGRGGLCPSVRPSVLFCFFGKNHKERQPQDGEASGRALLVDQSLPSSALCTTLLSMSEEAKTCNTIFSRQKKKLSIKCINIFDLKMWMAVGANTLGSRRAGRGRAAQAGAAAGAASFGFLFCGGRKPLPPSSLGPGSHRAGCGGSRGAPAEAGCFVLDENAL